MYWRYDEAVHHVELDYPRDISIWSGVPDNIDSVFQHFNGKTYFFKGQRYWKFDDREMKVGNVVEPSLENHSINMKWLKCPPREIIIRDPFTSKQSSVSKGGLTTNVIYNTHIFFSRCVYCLLLYSCYYNTILSMIK